MATLPVLSAAETQAAGALLDRVWGPGMSVRGGADLGPALAQPGAARVQVPDFWQPEV